MDRKLLSHKFLCKIGTGKDFNHNLHEVISVEIQTGVDHLLEESVEDHLLATVEVHQEVVLDQDHDHDHQGGIVVVAPHQGLRGRSFGLCIIILRLILI